MSSRTVAVQEPTVRLLSSNKQVHVVPRSVLKQSKMIEKLIQNLNIEQNYETHLPIMINVPSDILDLIIDWLKKHKNDDAPMIADCEGKRSRKVGRWDKEFLRPLTQSKVFELVKAAHLLDIKKLTDICCKTIASWMSGKDAPEIRSIFGLENDLTEEDIKESEREYKMLETCTCTSAHQTTRGFELRMFEKLREMERELDAQDRLSNELMAELKNLNLRSQMAKKQLKQQEQQQALMPPDSA